MTPVNEDDGTSNRRQKKDIVVGTPRSHPHRERFTKIYNYYLAVSNHAWRYNVNFPITYKPLSCSTTHNAPTVALAVQQRWASRACLHQRRSCLHWARRACLHLTNHLTNDVKLDKQSQIVSSLPFLFLYTTSPALPLTTPSTPVTFRFLANTHILAPVKSSPRLQDVVLGLALGLVQGLLF